MIKLPISILLAEHKEKTPFTRQPEPDLVMESESQVQAFHAGSEWGGVMDSIHIFNLCHLSEMIRPGDQVLDLGCGPADFLIKAALVHPEAYFTGVDLSGEMLQIARKRVHELNITNVKFVQGDMTQLNSLTPHSFDVVMSTLAVHHLPTISLFHDFRRNVMNLVRPDGAVLITDFSKVKSLKTVDLLAGDMTKRNAPAILVEDYKSSLKAAFSEEDFNSWALNIKTHNLKVIHTQLNSFVSVIRTPSRIPFFKRQPMTKLPLGKITLKSWIDYCLLKILCRREMSPASFNETNSCCPDNSCYRKISFWYEPVGSWGS